MAQSGRRAKSLKPDTTRHVDDMQPSESLIFPPIAALGLGELSSRIVESLSSPAYGSEIRQLKLTFDFAGALHIDATPGDLAFVIRDGSDTSERACQVLRSLNQIDALTFVLVRDHDGHAQEQEDEGPACASCSGVTLRLPDEGFEHAVTCVLDGFAGALGTRGVVGVDLADLRSAVAGGRTIVAIGYGAGPQRPGQAVTQALRSVSLTLESLKQASGIFVIVAGGIKQLRLREIREITDLLHANVGPDTRVYPGAYQHSRLRNLIRVTLICTFPHRA
jgi:hypothetical protein